MKIVFDTNVLISSSLWYNSVAHKLLIILIKRDVEIFTTIEILNEYVKVLKRDFKFSEEETKDIINKVINFLRIVDPIEKLNIVKDDPEDNKILECAEFSNSDFILTYDNHLLKLKKFKDIKIITPDELLEKIKNI